MQVVGYTTQQYIYVASRERKFNINEILVVEEEKHGNPKGEVVETQSFNRFLPMADENNAMVDEKVFKGLAQVGFNIDDEEVNIARVRLLEELASPVKVGISVRLPVFEEVKDLFLKKSPDEGFTLGVIQGTFEIVPMLPDELKNSAPLFHRDRGIIPQNGFPFVFDYSEMDDYPHVGIFGGSGSGKSYGLRVFLEEIMEKKIPAILFDPHFEMDFTQKAPGFEDDESNYDLNYTTLLVGRDVGINFTELSPDDLIGLLKASGGNISEAMENAVRSIYENKDSLVTFKARLTNLIEAFEKEGELKQKSGGSQETDSQERKKNAKLEELLFKYKDKVGHVSTLKGISWRLYNLEREGIFTSDIYEVEKGLLRRKLVVIRGSIWLLKVFAGYVAKKFYNLRRSYKDALQQGRKDAESFPPFLIVTDEAHNFAPTGFDAPAKGVFKEIAQEGRKYGVFLLLATQRPSLLDDTLTAQLNTKIVFRTVRSTDIQTIKEETDITSEESARLPYLSSGTSFISSAILGRTIAVRIRAAKTVSPHSENPFEELDRWFKSRDERLWNILQSYLPLSADSISLSLDQMQKDLGEPVEYNTVLELLEEKAREGKARKVSSPFGPSYEIG